MVEEYFYRQYEYGAWKLFTVNLLASNTDTDTWYQARPKIGMGVIDVLLTKRTVPALNFIPKGLIVPTKTILLGRHFPTKG